MFKLFKRFWKVKSKVKNEESIYSVNHEGTSEETACKSITKCTEDVNTDEEASSRPISERGSDVIVSSCVRSVAKHPGNDTPEIDEHRAVFAPKEDSVVEIFEEENEHPEARICNTSFEALSELEGLQPVERRYLLEKLDGYYPPVNFYDFCVIASDKDFELAEGLVELLKNIGLTGCVAGNQLGSDILEECNELVASCTKVLFLISENFTADGFCRRLQSAAVFQSLIARIALDRNKCVPVFSGDSGARRIPLPLMGIAGINLLERDTIISRIKATYTANVRCIKILKARKYLEEKEKFFRKLLTEHYESVLGIPHLPSPDTSSSSSNFQRIKYLREKSPTVSQKSKSSSDISPVREIVQNVQSLVAGFRMTEAVSDEVSSKQECLFYEDDDTRQLITIENSSEVHFGHQINLTVNVNNGPVMTVQSTDSE